MAMHKNKLKNYIEETKEVEKLRKVFKQKEKILLKKFKNIDDRIEYIINKLADLYKILAESWSYNNCSFDEHDGEYRSDGYFESRMLLNKDFYVCVNFADIDSYTDATDSLVSEIIINDQVYDPFMGNDLGPCEICFPTRWIFEDFEEELEKSRILYEIGRK